MKTAVVFYSRDGSTREAAKVIAQKFNADIYELEEVKTRGRSPLSFVAAGFSASVGKGSRLKSVFTEELKDCEKVYIGTPVWAGKPVPAVNTFIKKFDPSGKELVLFSVQADPNTDTSSVKCLETMKSKLSKKGCKVIKTAGFYGASPGKAIKTEDIKQQIDSKL